MRVGLEKIKHILSEDNGVVGAGETKKGKRKR